MKRSRGGLEMHIRTLHQLKILPEYYKKVVSGEKTFEIRKDDRGFKVGDLLELCEFEDGQYTGNSYLTEITYITYINFGGEYRLKEDYCILAIKPHKDRFSLKEEK